LTSGTKGERGFQPVYDRYKILSVLLKTREKKTSVIKKELCKIDQDYCNPTAKWYNEALQRLEKEGLVKRVNKEMDNAHYWTITEVGEKRKTGEINHDQNSPNPEKTKRRQKNKNISGTH
jgi:DNA-binding HxlR family transcriptional regulator